MVSGRGHLLHASGHVRDLPDRGVLHSEIAADRAHDHFPGVEPDADLDRELVSVAQRLGVLPDGRLHPQGHVAGPERMVLVGHRRPEQGHDAVAHDLVDRALVPMHRLDHPLQDRLQEPLRVLRVAPPQQLHGILQIGEEDGDVLAFPFDQVPRREDLSARWRGV